MSASSGQRWRARVLRRWCSEDFVEAGIVVTGLILSNAVRVGVVRRVGLATTRGRWTKVVMGVSCALVIVLCRIDHAVLTARARAGRSEHRDVVRARIVLAAAGAVRGRDQAMAGPVLDRPPRPALRGQGCASPGPVRPPVARPPARR